LCGSDLSRSKNAQTKGFPRAKFKSFSSRGSAEEFVEANAPKASASARPTKRARPSFFPRVKINIQFDGGSRGSSGASGAGAHVEIATDQKDGSFITQTVQVRKYLGTDSTNNIAEYHGLLCGLEEAKKAVMEFRCGLDKDGVSLKVIGDSDLVIQQMNGTFQCKSKNLIPLLREAKSLVEEMEELVPMEVSFTHVYRKDNRVADGKQSCNESTLLI
jgi:ribonuclease HI